MSRRPSDRAKEIVHNATVLNVSIDAALHNLDLGLAGWPESTPGASAPGARPSIECRNRDCANTAPCPDHDPDATQQLTATERLASTADKAALDLDALHEAIRKGAHQLAIAADIAFQWANVGVTDSTVKEKLLTIDAELYCKNCVRFGRHEVRAKERTECDFCAGFRQRFKQPAPKEIWSAKDARQGKLFETDIIRILKNLDTERKAKAATERARQRAEGKAS